MELTLIPAHVLPPLHLSHCVILISSPPHPHTGLRGKQLLIYICTQAIARREDSTVAVEGASSHWSMRPVSLFNATRKEKSALEPKQKMRRVATQLPHYVTAYMGDIVCLITAVAAEGEGGAGRTHIHWETKTAGAHLREHNGGMAGAQWR